MSRHPVSLKIDQTIDLLQRNNVPVTPGAVRINVRKVLTYADFTPYESLDAVIDARMAERFRAKGLVITDRESRIRKQFWHSEIAELEEQQEIKRQSSLFDANRIKADGAVIELLKAKRDEFGYEPSPDQFRGEIHEVYAGYGLAAPGDE